VQFRKVKGKNISTSNFYCIVVSKESSSSGSISSS
jgi:hypothetical protein